MNTEKMALQALEVEVSLDQPIQQLSEVEMELIAGGTACTNGI